LLANYLHPGGVFALWSNDPPDDDFLEALREVFASSEAHVVRFRNPMVNAEARRIRCTCHAFEARNTSSHSGCLRRSSIT
jgi:hypothetical protein